MKTKLLTDMSPRGFAIVNFNDLYQEKCSIQDSSNGEHKAIWIGVNSSRMHLTQDMVKQLLPFLQEFADKGDYLFTQQLFKKLKKKGK